MYEDFMKLIKERCSVRKFTDKAVDSKTLEQILQAAMYAPTALKAAGSIVRSGNHLGDVFHTGGGEKRIFPA